jgi:hypothetical protein
VYSGGHYIILYGDSSTCRGIKVVSGIICNYYTNKLFTENIHLITYSGQGVLVTSHSVEV